MSRGDARDHLARLLRCLRDRDASAEDGERAPALGCRPSGGTVTTLARLVLRRDAATDPVTGHRAVADALAVVAESDGLVVEAQLRIEAVGDSREGGPAAEGLPGSRRVVRGSVSASDRPPSDLVGALVHVHGEGERTPSLEGERTPSVNRERTPSVNRERTPSVNRESTPSVNRESTPSVNRERTASVNRERTPSVNRERSSSLGVVDERGAFCVPAPAGRLARLVVELEDEVVVVSLEEQEDEEGTSP